jgi:Short C-terminal domain
VLRRRPVMRVAATTAVVAGTATAVSGGVRRHQEAKAQQQAAAADTPTAAALPAEEPAQDSYEQLEKLGKLHQEGILTDEEFAAQKAKLLA